MSRARQDKKRRQRELLEAVVVRAVKIAIFRTVNRSLVRTLIRMNGGPDPTPAELDKLCAGLDAEFPS